MISDFLKKNITSQANCVEYGYAQVEPNHLSAQRTGQIYAQLPAASTIDKLENGQFVKYDYAKNEVNFTGAGEWMLVYNEIKLYRDGQRDCEFAMRRGDYIARIYSPVAHAEGLDKATISTRFYGGDGYVLEKDGDGNLIVDENGMHKYKFVEDGIEKVTAPEDPYELHYNGKDPMKVFGDTKPAPMNDVNALVPRVFKTNIGDIYTTNMVNLTNSDVTPEKLAGGVILKVGEKGILGLNGTGDMEWQVVKVYTLPDTQKAVKLMRIK